MQTKFEKVNKRPYKLSNFVSKKNLSINVILFQTRKIFLLKDIDFELNQRFFIAKE
jgi:hypothetical protein